MQEKSLISGQELLEDNLGGTREAELIVRSRSCVEVRRDDQKWNTTG
jgi:hypothetical protein